jgi:SnoaL-like domain
MTSTSTPKQDAANRGDQLTLAVAGRFIDGLAVRDFDAVVDTLTDDVSFRALLPHRFLELGGRPAVRSTLDAWFGGAHRWEMIEAVVGEVGGRIHIRWRLRLTNPDVGPGTFLVEQQVYADCGSDSRICDVALLCSGYRPEYR